MLTMQVLRQKRSQILELVARHGADNVRIFGSVARSEDRPDSDIDMLVSPGPNTSAWFPAGLVLDLQTLLGRKVEVVTDKGLNIHLRSQVLKEAIRL